MSKPSDRCHTLMGSLLLNSRLYLSSSAAEQHSDDLNIIKRNILAVTQVKYLILSLNHCCPECLEERLCVNLTVCS